jgi:GNAT superfamily N-acetyltransferase
MDISIRRATKEDMARVLELIYELALYENKPNAVELHVEDLEKAGFGDEKEFICFVAEVDGKIEGSALIYNRFSTWKGSVLHLEDLVVSKRMRGSGLGTTLLNEVVRFGQEIGVKRISWEVSEGNENAMKFYQNKGADIKRDWNVVHLDEEGIKTYLSQI